MVLHFQPQARQATLIDDGKMFFKLISHLNPAVTHLALKGETACQGARPEKGQDPGTPQDDEQGAPGATGSEDLKQEEHSRQDRPEPGIQGQFH